MPRVFEPTPEAEAEYRQWAASRPLHVRAVAERFDPWSLYRLGTQRVSLVSIDEQADGRVTVRVRVSAEFNLVLFERDVFGVDPDTLVPCDPPGPNEPTGALLTGADVDANLDEIRLSVRPDLWERGPDGRVRMKSDGTV